MFWLKQREEIKVWNTCMKPIYMEISHLKYGFVSEETLLTLSLPIFGLEELYLCIKVIFLLVLVQFCDSWKFRVKIGKPVEIAGEYRY